MAELRHKYENTDAAKLSHSLADSKIDAALRAFVITEED